MMLVAASIFMVFFSLNLRTVYIDNFLFQLSFVFIHIYLSIPLFKELIPPTFSNEQKLLYKSHFKKFFTPSEFKHLLSGVRRRVFKVSSSIVQRAKRPKDTACTIELKSGKNLITNLDEYSWIGIMEYISFIRDTGSLKKALELNETGIWAVDCLISFGSQSGEFLKSKEDKEFIDNFDESINEEEEDESYLNNKSELIVYEWDLESLNNVYSHKIYGTRILNGLHASWLKYSSMLVKISNENIVIKKEGGVNNSSLQTSGYFRKKSSMK